MANKDKKTKEQEQEKYDGSTPLKSVMQEMFVSSLLQGITQRKAYRQAGYKVSDKQLDSAASQLSRNIKIESRLAYKQGSLAKKLDITLERQCKEFETNKDLARGLNQISAANQAISEQSRLCGLYEVDNKQKQGKTVVEILALVANARRLEASGRHVEAISLPEGNTEFSKVIENRVIERKEDHG